MNTKQELIVKQLERRVKVINDDISRLQEKKMELRKEYSRKIWTLDVQAGSRPTTKQPAQTKLIGI